MKKLIFALSIILVSCQKEDDTGIIETNIQCSTSKLEVKNYLDLSYNLFEIIHPKQVNNFVDGVNYGQSYISVDYNNDGFLDLVGFQIDFNDFRDREDSYTGYERKTNIKFYLGTCSGNLIEDKANSDKFLGLVHGRKILVGDYNNDSFVDFFLIGHGYDRAPYPGEFNKVLMSNSSGKYTETEYKDYVSFYHGGASGDFDNDGDLDVFVIDAGRGRSLMFTNNNGVLTPNPSLIDQSLMSEMFNAEMVDFNKDGYLDLVLGGHDYSYGSDDYNNTSKIILGNGVSFTNNTVISVPPSINGQGVVLGFQVFDFNNDGVNELIINKTGDGKEDVSNFYKGWSLQVLEYENGTLTDSTSDFIDIFYGNTRWSPWIDITSRDGNTYLINSISKSEGSYLEWKLTNGKFIKN